MGFSRIDGPDDPRVADNRNFSDAELIRSRGLFIAEGRLIVRRVLEDAHYQVQSVLLNDAAARDLGPFIERTQPEISVLTTETRNFLTITGYDIHRGCLALVRRPAPPPLADLLMTARRLVVLEGVANADNVGATFRNMAALGGDAVVLSPSCCDPFYRKAMRTSMGAVLRMPSTRISADQWPACLVQIRSAGFTLVALTPRTPSESLSAVAARSRDLRLALLVGTESAGLSVAVEAAADLRARIPMSERVDSLNVAVAVAIALFELSAKA
ncbi:MAG TPA: RNA methyltransferase [Vicinamibacterales bacterium]|nr:RNA methyltransferase [Vicinamibacterales bacterium]